MKDLNFFYLAKNKSGQEDLHYMRYDSENVISIQLTSQNVLDLWDFGVSINEKFDKLIDLYEYETLEPELLPETLKTAQRFKEEATETKVKEAFDKAIEAINLAIKYNSPLVFWW